MLEEQAEKAKADGADELAIKRANDLLAETIQMVPNCQMRLQQAIDEVEELVVRE